MSEMAIGRNTRLNPIGACNKIKNGWGFVGGLGVLGAFIILCYYSVIGGWVLKYLFKYIISSSIDNPSEYFKNFTESIYEPILWHITFAIICIIIVMKGISGGIEKNKQNFSSYACSIYYHNCNQCNKIAKRIKRFKIFHYSRSVSGKFFFRYIFYIA